MWRCLPKRRPTLFFSGVISLLDLMEDLALADRAAGMRTDVLVGQHLAAGAENADLDLVQDENPVVAVGDIGQLAHRDFVHRLSPSHSIPGGR